MITASITFEFERADKAAALEALFFAAVNAAAPHSPKNDPEALGRPWIDLPADLYFWAARTMQTMSPPATVLEKLLQRFPEVAGVRVAGRDARPLRPSILEVAPREFFKKEGSLPDFSRLLADHWRAQAQEVVNATPPGHFALFSAPSLEGDQMRFRLAYLPAEMLPPHGQGVPGIDPALSWYVGPVKPAGLV